MKRQISKKSTIKVLIEPYHEYSKIYHYLISKKHCATIAILENFSMAKGSI